MSARRLFSRRRAFATAAGLLLPRAAEGDEVAVPPRLQAELLVKVAPYDRNLATRAGDAVRVLVMSRPGHADSDATAAQFERALSGVETIGGLGARVETRPYAGAAALRALCARERASIVYLAGGFEPEAEAIADALAGLDLLSVGATAELVPRRIVLGFELTSGRPKLLVNLTQARRQNVAFRTDVLKLMKVYV
jgi:hypothetical protein